MLSPNLIDPPPTQVEDNGGGQEQWSVFCKFEGWVPDATQKHVLDTIDTSAAFVFTPSSADYILAFRERGQIDEAIAGAIISLRGIREAIINPIQKVEMISLRDAARTLDNDEKLSVFSITQSVKAALGER
jgi:hypothetical protein